MPRQTAEVEIKLSNGQQAGKTINELTAQSAKLARELKKMEIGSAEYVKTSEDYQLVAGRLKNVKSETFNTAKAQGMLNSEMGQYIPFNKQLGGMITTFKGLSGAIKATTISQRALNIAIAASGIGLIIIVLVKLVQAFLETQAGMDAVTKVTRPLFAIFERLKGVIQDLGGSVFKGLGQILNGDIKEGLKTLGSGLKDAVGGMGDAVREGAKVGTQIDQLTKKIEKAEINMIKRQAELAREYKLQSEIAENVAASEEDRRKAAQRAIEVANEEIKLQQDLIDMKIEKIKLEQSLNDTSRAQEKELAELEAERINLETQGSERRTTARSKLNTVNQSIAGQEKKAHEDAMKANQERLDAIEKERAARAKYIEDTIKAELEAREEQKKLEKEMSEGIKEEQEKNFNDKLANLTVMNQAEQDMIDLLFFENQIGQEERDAMQYEAKKSAIQAELDLLIGAGKTSSEAYQKLYTEMAQLNYEHNQKKLKDDENYANAKMQLEYQAKDAAFDAISATIDLLSKDENARRKNYQVIKALKLAELSLSSASEIQEIWRWAQANPLNGIFPGAAQVIAGVKTGAALIRYGVGVSKINSTKFAEGGPVFGPSHAGGGIPFSVRGRGGYEMEGNEIILSKGVYENPVLRAMASDINAMGGGRSFAMGGPVVQDRGFVNTSSAANTPSAAATAGARSNPSSQRTEMYLAQIAANTKRQADKPELSIHRIREENQRINEVEQDATF